MPKKKIQSNLIFFLAAFILIASIIFSLNKDRFDPSQQIINIEIKDKKIVKPADPIKIKQNKKVTLYIDIDQPEQLHLEGYHAFTTLFSNKTNKLEFESLTPGKFHLYLDKSRTYLGSVDIN